MRLQFGIKFTTLFLQGIAIAFFIAVFCMTMVAGQQQEDAMQVEEHKLKHYAYYPYYHYYPQYYHHDYHHYPQHYYPQHHYGQPYYHSYY